MNTVLLFSKSISKRSRTTRVKTAGLQKVSAELELANPYHKRLKNSVIHRREMDFVMNANNSRPPLCN